MKPAYKPLLALLVPWAAVAVLSATVLPGRAESVASSASSAGSAASGSASDSLKGSSNSSQGDRRAANGDYRVIDVAQATGRPGLLTIRLQPTTADVDRARSEAARDGDTIELTLPASALAARPLTAGDLVTARPRPYGIEFAYARTTTVTTAATPTTASTTTPTTATAAADPAGHDAFFLVLDDDWQRELAPRPVAL